jgi:hypothetical protein
MEFLAYQCSQPNIQNQIFLSRVDDKASLSAYRERTTDLRSRRRSIEPKKGKLLNLMPHALKVKRRARRNTGSNHQWTEVTRYNGRTQKVKQWNTQFPPIICSPGFRRNHSTTFTSRSPHKLMPVYTRVKTRANTLLIRNQIESRPNQQTCTIDQTFTGFIRLMWNQWRRMPNAKVPTSTTLLRSPLIAHTCAKGSRPCTKCEAS